MEKHGYSRGFAAALTAASSVIGPIIPPSIPVIIYALTVTGVSVPALFVAGIVPGVLLAIFLSVYVAFTVKIDHGEESAALTGGQSAGQALRGGIIPILMPVFVVGSILLGVVTPTEAASFAVAYALAVGVGLYRRIRLADLPRIFASSMRDSAVIMLIISAVARRTGS